MLVEIFDRPIDINNPDYVLPLRELKCASEIYKFCRERDLSHFGYGFRYVRDSYSTTQIKFGYSAPDPAARSAIQRGERLVRQASWLPGWPTPVHSDHGSALWEGCKRLIATKDLPEDVDYRDFEIAVWSTATRNTVAGYNFTSKEAAMCIESILCDQYKDAFGKLPHLNIADPTTNKLYNIMAKSTALKFFTFVDTPEG